MSKQISKIYHAAIYVRLSKEDGDVSTSAKAESNSISNQKDFIRNFLADKKDIRIVKEYVDDGYSGSNFDRPSFQTMMEDIKRGVIDCVVVKDLSRFGREYIDSGRYIERLFPALGVRFIAINDKGYTPIAKYLNEQGIMSPLMYLKSLGYQQNVRTNGVWTKTTVKSILTNQAYIGSAVHGKVVIEKYNNIPLHATDPSEWVVVENTHEPLIDKKTFEKAQERVKEISDAYFAKEFTKHPPNEKNLLKGKIVCGDCGKGMRLSPRTTKSYVYFCGTFSDGINPACSRHKIDQEEVNKAVFAQISNHMRCCIDALKVIRELNARSSGLKKYNVYEKAITRQRRELEKVNRKFSELYGDYSEHLINESEYLTLKQQYLLKSEALKKEIDNLLISQNLYSKNYKIDADWENLINKYLKCRKLNKELADAFVDKVQVFEGGRISVNLVYDDCLEELLQVKNKREGDLDE